MKRRDKLLDELNDAWADRSRLSPGAPYMPAAREGTIDLTRSGPEGTIDRLALWRALRRAA